MKNTPRGCLTAGGAKPPRVTPYISIQLVSLCKHSNSGNALPARGRQPRRGIENYGSPRRGTGFASHTKTLPKGGFPPEAIASSPYRGRPWRGWMFLGSFFAPKNEQYFLLLFEKKAGKACKVLGKRNPRQSARIPY